MTFGDRLRELREKAGLTQESLAVKAGMSIGSVRNYEQGVREPYWRGVFQLAKALGVSADEFAVCLDDGGSETGEGQTKKGSKRWSNV